MVTATQNPRQAVALLLAFALDPGEDVRSRQLKLIAQQLGAGASRAVQDWLPQLDSLVAMQRLPAFLRLFPAMQRFSRLDKERLARCLKSLLQEEQRLSLHSYALAKLAEVHLHDELEPMTRARRATIASVREELQVLFSVLAGQGHDNATASRHAYEVGMHHLLPKERPSFAPPTHWPARLDVALGRLDELQPAAKEQLVEALVKTIGNDLRLTIEESELLRTVCAAIHCPLPPLLAGETGTVSG